MTSAPATGYLQPQWFIPLFVAMWLGITGLLSYIGGWASLASKLPDHADVNGQRFRFRSSLKEQFEAYHARGRSNKLLERSGER